MIRSVRPAATRAAPAALTQPHDTDFDRYLLIDDTDEFITEIRTIVRERSRHPDIG
jgi:hypothetical protein